MVSLIINDMSCYEKILIDKSMFCFDYAFSCYMILCNYNCPSYNDIVRLCYAFKVNESWVI